jgi:hypothetical protein
MKKIFMLLTISLLLLLTNCTSCDTKKLVDKTNFSIDYDADGKTEKVPLGSNFNCIFYIKSTTEKTPKFNFCRSHTKNDSRYLGATLLNPKNEAIGEFEIYLYDGKKHILVSYYYDEKRHWSEEFKISTEKESLSNYAMNIIYKRPANIFYKSNCDGCWSGRYQTKNMPRSHQDQNANETPIITEFDFDGDGNNESTAFYMDGKIEQILVITNN